MLFSSNWVGNRVLRCGWRTRISGRRALRAGGCSTVGCAEVTSEPSTAEFSTEVPQGSRGSSASKAASHALRTSQPYSITAWARFNEPCSLPVGTDVR
ncbi:hypothetical protein CSA17_03010 [bacterium DOLJORAL78_65_58]|nr:MAG: hypothetical protein CSA17_03010 [bacterium DOLJORAL78_65_58]